MKNIISHIICQWPSKQSFSGVRIAQASKGDIIVG